MKRLLPALAAATLILAPLTRAQNSTATAAAPISSTAPTAPNTALNNDDSATPMDRRAEHRAEMLKRFDTNGDGVLDAKERAAMHAALKEKRAERLGRLQGRMLKKYDKNGDGVLDASEQTAALANLETRPRFIARFDKDGDGKLNDAEKANAENTMRTLWSRQQTTANATSMAPAPETK